jgi:putative SOS response-associated peptidase YedK
LNGDRVFGFAGLWDRWKGPKDAPLAQPVESYTILTTAPNSVAGKLHDRMPVMLIAPEHWDRWLDRSITDASALQPLLRPIADDAMRAYPVSTRVNTPANDDAELLREQLIAEPPSAFREPGLFEQNG